MKDALYLDASCIPWLPDSAIIMNYAWSWHLGTRLKMK